MTTPIEAATRAMRPEPRRPPMQVVRGDGSSASEDAVMSEVSERRKQAKRDRARYEPDWYLCQSYVANKQWVGWATDRGGRNGRVLSMLGDPNERYREHHTENIITSYLWTAVGQLAAQDTFLPPISFRRDAIESVQYANEARVALRYAWQEELNADEEIEDALLSAATFGTGGCRLFVQRGQGDSYGEFPIDPETGRMVTSRDRYALVANAERQGIALDYQTLQAQLCLESLEPFNMLVPPGVQKFSRFPWIFVECPYPVDQLRAMFPDRAADIQEQNLAAVDYVGLRSLTDSDNSNAASAGRLKGHALLSTMYEPPTRNFQKGRVVFSTADVLLEEVTQLPFYVNKRWVAGIAPFLYRRVKGRFWGLGVVEPLLGVQRQRNRARSQHIEWKDRNLGRVYAPKDAINVRNLPTGKIMELVDVHPAYVGKIQETTPGTLPNVEAELNMLNDAAERVAGFGPLAALSTAPQGMHAYAALALAKQSDDQRNGPIIRASRRAVASLAKTVLSGMRTYWPPGKEIVVPEDGEEQFASFVFNAADLPPEAYVSVESTAVLPIDPAAQVQLAFDVFDRSVSSAQPLPLEWLVETVTKGQLQPLPHGAADLQRDKAEYENMLMAQGSLPPVAPYDNDQLHVQIHREAQALRTMEPGQEQVVALIEEHVQQHLADAVQKAQQATAPSQQGPQGALGGRTPGGPVPATPGAAPQGSPS